MIKLVWTWEERQCGRTINLSFLLLLNACSWDPEATEVVVARRGGAGRGRGGCCRCSSFPPVAAPAEADPWSVAEVGGEGAVRRRTLDEIRTRLDEILHTQNARWELD